MLATTWFRGGAHPLLLPAAVVLLGLGGGCSDATEGTNLSQVGVDAPLPPDLSGEGFACESDLDCATLPFDPCERWSCAVEGQCVLLALEDGSACDDHNPCTLGDECAGGVCVTGANGCECDGDEDCDAFQDEDLCNGVLACEEGLCVVAKASVVTCDPSPPGGCTSIACNPSNGACETEVDPDGTVCDDADACTSGETCQGGACLADAVVACAPSGPCTKATCDPAAGCGVEPAADGIPCSDGNPCTGADSCLGGSCLGGPVVCPCTTDVDCAAFDVDLCDAPFVCEEGQCVTSGGAGVVCPEPEDPCLQSACVPATGDCVDGPAPDGTSCGVGIGCAAGAVCAAGICTPPAGACDDGNPCTEDACDPALGCQSAPVEGACDDDSFCTEGDHCEGGTCVGSPAECDCDVDDDCTGGKYDPCLGKWTCIDGQCGVILGTAVDCKAKDGPCTKGTCNPATLACEAAPLEAGTPCDDEKPCTVDTTCTGGTCGGGVPNPCDDGNACTNDSCQVGLGCKHVANQAPCDDGNACTKNDVCVGGGCFGGSAVKCSTQDPCLTSTCKPAEGCVLAPAPDGGTCNDKSDCTDGDHCSGGTCVGQSACECESDDDCPDDGDLCNGMLVCFDHACVLDPASVPACEATSDCKVPSCDKATGLCAQENAKDGTSCSDGGPCKLEGKCQGGTCAADAVSCDDGNPCTSDSCDPATGSCVHGTEVTAACSDGDPCTTADACSGGQCKGGGALACDDGNACTSEACKTGVGCTFEPLGSCDDASACTVDSCDPTKGCIHTAKVCTQPSEPCKAAACNPQTGQCQAGLVPNGTPCEDEDPCSTGPGTCQGGACEAAPSGLCDDGDPCTLDLCSSGGVCDHDPAPPGGACDDGNLCTTGDVCSAGVCAGIPYDCDDDDDCTLDGCAAGHCTNEPIPGCAKGIPCIGSPGSACDDLDATTTADMCVLGLCRGFTRKDVTPDATTGSRLYHRLDRSHDRWFLGVLPLSGETITGGAIATWNGSAAQVHAETSSSHLWRGVHRGFAANTGGELVQFDPTAAGGAGLWRKDTALVLALAGSGPAEARDMWSSNLSTLSGPVTLWVVGEDQDEFWIRGCRQFADGNGGFKAECKSENLDAQDGVVPQTVAGTDCGGCDHPHLVLGGDYYAGMQGNVPYYYNDTLEHEGTIGNGWDYGYLDNQSGPTVQRDSTAMGDERYLHCGHYGYLRYRNSFGQWSFNLQLKANQSERFFEGIWTGAEVVVVGGWRQSGDSQRTFELWTVAVDSGNTSSGSNWTVLTLGTGNGGLAALYDVWGLSDGTILAVGAAKLSGDLYGGVVFTRKP